MPKVRLIQDLSLGDRVWYIDAWCPVFSIASNDDRFDLIVGYRGRQESVTGFATDEVPFC
jgi:hypothetical protein